MDNRDKAVCDGFVEYMTGEAPEVDRKRFERHLLICAACREDAAEWRFVWEQLAEDATTLEPPEDLKAEVMDAIFSPRRINFELEQDTGVSSQARFRKPMKWIAFIAAVAVAFFAGSWWRDFQSPSKEAAGQVGVLPSQIEKLYPLDAVQTSGKFKAGGHAYGVACLIRSNEEQQLIVYVFGSPKTEGSEAYHVWLSKDGVRRSAGTFTVGNSGIGLLTLPWTEESPSFDAVGVTLEPDANSDEPRGPKLFGSA